MKIYIASSWKNEQLVKEWGRFLRIIGHEVDCFCDDSTGRYVFHWSELGKAEELDAISFLDDARTKRAFEEDKKQIDWADAVLLILPAGKSSHLEAGYAVGSGKRLLIWQEKFPKGEFDVMYGFADVVTDSVGAIIRHLSLAMKWKAHGICLHEETYRGGAIWNICSQCGKMWADDEGGKPRGDGGA